MDEQFEYLIKIFNSFKINYWVDSGTLLGLIREGKLITHDMDIDIGIWREEEQKLNIIINYLKQKGYRIKVFSFDNINYKYKIIPGDDKKRIIDINLFNEFNEFAWCPAARRVPKNNIDNIFLYPIYRIIRYFVHYSINHYFKHVSFSNIVLNNFYNMVTWWIPSKFFKDTKTVDGFIQVPKMTENYLKYRYGEWEIPKKDWFFLDDDLGLKQISPYEIMYKSIISNI